MVRHPRPNVDAWALHLVFKVKSSLLYSRQSLYLNYLLIQNLASNVMHQSREIDLNE